MLVESVNGRPIREVEFEHDGRVGLPPAFLVRDERVPFDVLGVASTSPAHRMFNRFHEYAHVLLRHSREALPESVRPHLPEGFASGSVMLGHGKHLSTGHAASHADEEVCELLAAQLMQAVARANTPERTGFASVLQ
ncbi:hypothetical protein [Leifsonia aquatica]|uniref:hypothetical protein n=1 Tax=Leifsonia aquatica TaxID=144185 RepID=UPI0038087CF9